MQVGQQGSQVELRRRRPTIAGQLGIGQGEVAELPGAAATAHQQGRGVIEAHLAGIAHDAQQQRPARGALAVGHQLPGLVIEIPQAFQAAQHRHAVFIFMAVELGRGLTRQPQPQQQPQPTRQQTAQKSGQSRARHGLHLAPLLRGCLPAAAIDAHHRP